MGTPHAGYYYPDHLGNNGVTASNRKIQQICSNIFFNKHWLEIIERYLTVPANVTIYDYLKHRNNPDLFLTPVSEEGVIGVVRLWESKTSTDYEDISMKVIKKLIDFIAKSITYIYKLSFSMGIFPKKT